MYWQYRVQHGSSDILANMKFQIVPQSSGNDPAVEFKFSHSGNDAGPIDVNFPSVKSVLQGSETVPYSATPTFSTTTRSSTIALTGNITNFTFAAGADGQEKTLIFCQDSTGNHTVTAPPQVRASLRSARWRAGAARNTSRTARANQLGWLIHPA